MVYRGLDIGTAKPSAAIRAAVPHHLIDILEPSEVVLGRTVRARRARARSRRSPRAAGCRCSSEARCCTCARCAKGSRCCRAPTRPCAPSSIAEAARSAGPRCTSGLRAVDPAAAARIAPSDRQRIQRALEVHALTGRPLTRAAAKRGAARAARRSRRVRARPGGPSRLARADRAAFRRDGRRAGFVAEVERLRARGDLHPDMPARARGRLSADLGVISTATATGQRRAACDRRDAPAMRNGSSRGCAPTSAASRGRAFAPDLVQRSARVARYPKQTVVAKNGRRLC